VDLGNYAQAIWELLSAACANSPQTDPSSPTRLEAWQALVLDYHRGQAPLVAPCRSRRPFGASSACGLGFTSSWRRRSATLSSVVYGQASPP